MGRLGGMSILKVLICCAFLFPATGFAALADNLRLADALQSNMVIQPNKPVKVWGKAAPGQQVVINADWTSSPTTIQADCNGDFNGLIPVPKVERGEFEPHALLVAAEGKVMELNKILSSDVG